MRRMIKGVYRRFLRWARIVKYELLSTNTCVGGNPRKYQPVQLSGRGTIKFESEVKIGVASSPNFWTSNCYIEARSQFSKIEIGRNTWINNGFAAICEDSSISIGSDCLIGHDVFVIDSNFHSLNPDTRHHGGKRQCQPVHIGNNVFIGSRVTILKNTTIGDGSVIGAGSVVSGEFAARSLISGNPATLVRVL